MMAPLVPAEVDLRDFAFMPLDVARLRDSELASNETPEACWAAVLLWSASWHQLPAASIPNDDKWIAKQAGYVSRGKVAKEWADVRAGALRGFVECSDGRLYHPVVAEKAMDAWKAKLRQRLTTECSRIKKHNQRHGMSIPYPEFEAWFAAGCPQGQPLPVPEMSPGHPPSVPRDSTPMSPECPPENQSKGQGEGQGEGQGQGQEEKEKPPKPPEGVGGGSASPGSVHGFPPGFEAFWSAYPRKVGKDAAAKAFAKRKPDRGLLERMLAAIAEQRLSEAMQREGGRFVPHPATWLNEGRWLDENPATAGDELPDFLRERGL